MLSLFCFFFPLSDTVQARPTIQSWDLDRWWWGWTWAFKICVSENDAPSLFHLTLVMGKMEWVSKFRNLLHIHLASLEQLTCMYAGCVICCALEYKARISYLIEYYFQSLFISLFQTVLPFCSAMNILSVLHFKSYYCCGQCKDLPSTKGNTCPSDAMLSKWKAPGTLVLQRDVNTVLDSRE